MLQSRVGNFEGLIVADIFAGTGALGLEAMSRGAAKATFVEMEKQALAALKANIAKLGATADIVPASVASLGPARTAHDILFFDPPYGTGGAGALIERLTRLGWASEAAWASIETAVGEDVSARGWEIDAVRRHGKAQLTLLRRGLAEPAD